MKFRRHDFTLFELLISIALLVVLSVVLLRIFVLTGDFWSAGEEQARLYADAKTALSIISEDLENIVYQNTSAAGTDAITAPLWLEAYDIDTAKKIYAYNSYAKVDGTPGAYTVALHMITRTGTGRDASAKSDICEVEYYFLPPTRDGTDWSTLVSGDGTLLRSCVDDHESEYNFLGRTSSTTMPEIFHLASNPNNVQETPEELITGVLDFRVYAQIKRTGDTVWNDKRYPADLVNRNGDRVVVMEINDNGEGQTDLKGAVGIDTIQIVLTVMPPKRIAELRAICLREQAASGAARAVITRERNDFVFKYARTFQIGRAHV